MGTHWTTLDAENGLYTATYGFGAATINTLVVTLGDGKLMVLGPGTKMSDDAFAELDGLGKVVAIVSPGPFHHMGFPEWQARYPDAGLYACTKGCDRIAKQHKGVELGLQDLDALQALLPEHVHVGEVAGMRMPDLHVVVQHAGGGCTWFGNELLQNEQDWPASAGVKLGFKLTGTRLGLGINNFTRMFFGGAKGPIRAFFDGQLAKSPPTRLVPSHGQIINGDDLPQRMQQAFADTL